MSDALPAPRSPGPRTPRSALGYLLLIAIFAAAIVGLTRELTRERVAASQAERTLALLRSVLGEQPFDNAPHADTILVSDPDLLGSADAVPAYRARLGAKPVAVVLTARAPQAYSGPIRLLVGIAADGTLLGVRVIEHEETPGLGDAIDARRSPWILQFSGRSLTTPPGPRWAVARDGGEFDQVSGATVTSRAVVAAVRDALRYFEVHRDVLLAP